MVGGKRWEPSGGFALHFVGGLSVVTAGEDVGGDGLGGFAHGNDLADSVLDVAVGGSGGGEFVGKIAGGGIDGGEVVFAEEGGIGRFGKRFSGMDRGDLGSGDRAGVDGDFIDHTAAQTRETGARTEADIAPAYKIAGEGVGGDRGLGELAVEEDFKACGFAGAVVGDSDMCPSARGDGGDGGDRSGVAWELAGEGEAEFAFFQEKLVAGIGRVRRGAVGKNDCFGIFLAGFEPERD